MKNLNISFVSFVCLFFNSFTICWSISVVCIFVIICICKFAFFYWFLVRNLDFFFVFSFAYRFFYSLLLNYLEYIFFKTWASQKCERKKKYKCVSIFFLRFDSDSIDRQIENVKSPMIFFVSFVKRECENKKGKTKKTKNNLSFAFNKILSMEFYAAA